MSAARPSDPVDPPSEAVAVARRYLRVERAATVGFGVVVGLAGAAAVLALPLVPALAVVAGALVLFRVPVVRSAGAATLRTGADPETVRAAVAGPTPPPLALQWGIADEVTRTDDGARYEVTYALGLRSTTMTVAAREAGDETELVVTADGRPWATYAVRVEADGGGSRVRVEWTSDRRFGLRRLPQRVVARRYRGAALAAQGYETVRREGGLRL